MAESGAEHPLLDTLSESQKQIQRNQSESRRFRRVKTAPSAENAALQKHTESSDLLPPAKKLFKKIRPSFKLVAFLLCVYLLIGVTIFYIVMGQISGRRTVRILDALYFCIVTMTTVGYGDLFPNSDATKLLCCAFVFSGMALMALFLSKSADYLVEKQEVLFFKALRMRTQIKGGEASMLRSIESNKIKYKFWATSLSLVTIMLAGTLFLWKVEKLTLVDSFYCVCATITTLGYGYESFKSEWGRIFAVVWILAGTIIVAQFFFYLAELSTERRQKSLTKWVLKRKMTSMDLEAMDIEGHREVRAPDFVLYKLKEMGKITQNDIAPLMEEFARLDVDHSGTLSTHDLFVAQSEQ